jgi:hypothetical protein
MKPLSIGAVAAFCAVCRSAGQILTAENSSASPSVIRPAAAESRQATTETPSLFRETVAVFVAALAGTGVAFFLERLARARDRKTAYQIDGAETLVVLTDQANSLLMLKSQYLDPFAAKSDRWIWLRSGSRPKYLGVDSVDLRFLTELGRPALLFDVRISERISDLALDLLVQRNQLRSEVLEPRIESLTRRLGRTPSAAEVEAEVGPRYTEILIDLTNHLFSCVDSALQGNEVAFHNLRAELKHLFPTGRFLDREPVAKLP